TKLVNILSNTLGGISKFRIEHISTFPLRGYHTEKKPYIPSDDLNCQYYYRKVACEKRLPLLNWATLSNYFHEYIQGGTYLFQISVDNYNPTSENDYNNPFLSSALSRDSTLILTWDIKTYSSRKTGDVPNAKYEEDVVFMICMTVHWKDDPELLKQICLVDVKIALDSQFITIICGSQ
ncbi:1972_t:CDS:2, partial [Funneliformis geosporum]